MEFRGNGNTINDTINSYVKLVQHDSLYDLKITSTVDLHEHVIVFVSLWKQ